MQLSDFLGALKSEIELAQPDLAGWLGTLASTPPGAPEFAAALESYAGQVERLSQTCEMLGLAGLKEVCVEVGTGVMMAAQQDDAARPAACATLAQWPGLVMAWLDTPADFGAAGAIVENFSAPGAAMPPDETRQLDLLTLLTTPPQLPPELQEEADNASQPIEISPADVSLELPADADADVYAAFMDEAPDNASGLSALMARIVSSDAGAAAGSAALIDDLRNAKRLAHSFKGSANIVGIKGIATLAHHTEDILEYLETIGQAPPRAMGRALQDASGTLEQMVYSLLGLEDAPDQAWPVLQTIVAWAEKIKTGEIAPDEEVAVDGAVDSAAHNGMSMAAAPILETAPPAEAVLERISRDESPESAARADLPAYDRRRSSDAGGARELGIRATDKRAADKGAADKGAEPAPGAARRASDPGGGHKVSSKTVDDLFRLVSELTIKTGQLETKLKASQQRSRKLLAHNLSVQQRIFELENLVMIRGLSISKSEAESGAVLDPLELDRYNELHGATRALVEATADARELGLDIEEDVSQLAAGVNQHARLNKELQYLVMATRMLPVSTLAPRLMRNVRQTAQTVGKNAELIIEGGDILVDGDVLSGLADPLLHILRNAVDHGIEMPDERAARGKPVNGRVTLAFLRQGSSVVVRVRDDGRGLDYDAIRSKGVTRGLLAQDAKPDNHELARLTLLPGFSTRDQVSEVSGRGVGMDVVLSRLQAMKGTVDIRSVTGEGCEVNLSFQASLVTQHCLIIESAGQRFAVPSHNLEQALSPGLGEFSMLGRDWTMRLGQKVHPVRTLAGLMGMGPDLTSTDALTAAPMVMLRLENQTMAVAVEKVVDSRDLIIKGMSKYLRNLKGVAGSAILGDGSVAPLLDIAELLRGTTGRGQGGHAGGNALSAAGAAAQQRAQMRRVLVVDDSLSVRKSLVQLLEDFAYEVRAAGDGMEAVRLLAEFTPHAVLTDLEMPNMNGIELTEHLRSQPGTRDMPVIMITSRSMDKHRQMAERAGVNAYLTKPYTDSDLLKHVREATEQGATQPAAPATAQVAEMAAA